VQNEKAVQSPWAFTGVPSPYAAERFASTDDAILTP